MQRIDVPNPKTYIGTGKILEVAEFVKEHEIGSVIFDDELSPAQQKNIARELKCKIELYLKLNLLHNGHSHVCNSHKLCL